MARMIIGQNVICITSGSHLPHQTFKGVKMSIDQVSQNDPEDQIIEGVEHLGLTLQDEQRRKIREKISQIKNYVPKVGVLGKTGAGKSSLCNALFGKKLYKINDITACTREPQSITLSFTEGSGGIALVDVPGVGESRDRDIEYSELYKNLLPELDLVLWVIKGDDRALSIDEQFFKECVEPHKATTPVAFVINQVDKIEPYREWDEKNKTPSPKQLENIRMKAEEVAKVFNVSSNEICAVSADEGFGLVGLVEHVINILPNEKKFGFARETKKENISTKSAKEVERGVWETIKEYAGKIGDFYTKNKTAIHTLFGVLWKLYTKKKT
ncbi:MAG: GTP-binding protein [Nitrosomonas sp.]|nr:MAG: GTP-binding protein [Nitrosomonas sp.]